MNKEIIYQSIRDEIIDQKKCQFQLFSIAVTVTSAILAFAKVTTVGPLVYVAPMLLVELALIVIFDKAITIQRKVGYLQKIEQSPKRDNWPWETHLDIYRALPEQPYVVNSADESRKHAYVTSVGLMLITLSAFCASLYFFGPTISSDGRAVGWVDGVIVIILFSSIYFGASKRNSLVSGINCSSAISAKWAEAIRKTCLTIGSS